MKREPLDEDSSKADTPRKISDVTVGGAGNMATAMERHVQQTNERLHCIKEVGEFSFYINPHLSLYNPTRVTLFWRTLGIPGFIEFFENLELNKKAHNEVQIKNKCTAASLLL